MTGAFLSTRFPDRDDPDWPRPGDWLDLARHLEERIAARGDTAGDEGLLDIHWEISRGGRYWSTAFQISELGRYRGPEP